MSGKKIWHPAVDLTNLISSETTILWLRRDLRQHDQAAFYYALKESKEVLPVFIFDTNILDKLEDNADRRLDFIHQTLLGLKRKLEELGSSLWLLHGNPIEIYKAFKPKAVYVNHDYESYARQRDGEVQKILEAKGSILKTHKDQVIFEKDEVTKDDGTPYTIFTPYSRKWKARLNKFYTSSYPTEKYFTHLKKVSPLPFPELGDIGFISSNAVFPERTIKTSIIKKYDTQRNFPAIQGTSRLSLHLRFGTVSIRKVTQIALKQNEIWLNELIWREFYHMILWHFPHVETKAFKRSYDTVQWNNDPEDFKAWCDGRTGYPIVDAGMRELNQTGFMHNRVRMIVASFLTKHLLIDWRWGEAYFADKLLDFDLASNNGGWQWAAGCGCDAAPYFRVFNPYLQTKKFDPELKYIRKWVPEFESSEYTKPIVNHTAARERVLRAYQEALSNA